MLGRLIYTRGPGLFICDGTQRLFYDIVFPPDVRELLMAERPVQTASPSSDSSPSKTEVGILRS